jgi:hypothetical protein
MVILFFAGTFIAINAQALESSFPKWIENNLEWKNQGIISDSEFVDGVSWLIDNQIITVPTEPPIKKTSDKILDIKLNWSESFANNILEICEESTHCAVDELKNLAISNVNQKTILKTYYDLMDYYKANNFSCHNLSHHIAEFLYEYLGDLSLALEYEDPMMCGGGNYHALVYSHILSDVEDGEDPNLVDILSICPNESAIEPSIARWECIHGIGHGLLKTNSDTISAVQRCDEFENDWEKTSCSKGLFMENIVNFYEDGSGTISLDDLFFPCNILEDESPPCYHYQARLLFNENKQNFNISFEECEKAPTGFEKYCYRGLGNLMAFAPHNDSYFSEKCLDATPDYQESCYLGIAMVYADNRSVKEALEFCATIPNDFQFSCYGEVGKWIKMVYDEPLDRLDACLVSNNLKYFETCIKADFNKLAIL